MKVFVIFVVVVGVLLGLIANIIKEVIEIKDIEAPRDKVSNDTVIVGDKAENLIWFVQISDLHLSVFNDIGRMMELRQFCDQTVRTIRPKAVLATGDLTDAKNKDGQGSRQFEQEWNMYQSVLRECEVEKITDWLDIRGNHDSFNILSSTSQTNMFKQFSVQGPKGNLRSYKKTIAYNGVKVAFIGVDASPEPGPKRPFNFIGVLNKSELDNLTSLASEAELDSDHTVWFGHYPTSCLITPPPGLRQVMSSGMVYLCGHLHSLLGLVPSMYTRHHNGLRELELQDWKDGRYYRLLSIDHGVLAFSDIRHDSVSGWPVIHLTWPPHPTHTAKDREPLHRFLTSTHIRMLIFSPHPISSCHLSLDDSPAVPCSSIDGTLFTSPWQPALYSTASHTITVTAVASSGQSNSITRSFSLDNSAPPFPLPARILLMTNISMMSQIVFSLFLFLTTIPLCLARTWPGPHLHPPLRWFRTWTRRWSLLASLDCMFYPLVLAPLYIAIGPWLVGEIIEGHTGVMFIWGTFVAGSYLPGSLSYLYAAIQLCLANLPTQICLAVLVDNRRKRCLGTETSMSFAAFILSNVPFLLCFLQQLWMMFNFFAAYGSMAAVLGPIKTWTTIMHFALWMKVSRLDQNSFSV